MDVIVNVALGSGTEEEKLQSLAWLVENQKQILGMGPNNLVNLTGLYNSYAQMLQLRGFKNVDLFFTNPETTPPPPEKPDPSMMLAQLQAQDIQATIAAKSAENNLKREQMLRNDDLERDKLDADIFLRKMELELTHNAKISTAQLNAELTKNRELFKAGTDMIHAAQADAMKAQSVQVKDSAATTPHNSSKMTRSKRRLRRSKSSTLGSGVIALPPMTKDGMTGRMRTTCLEQWTHSRPN
jgi:hypothetical protein